MKKLKFALLISAGCFSLWHSAAPASAAVMKAVYTGTVSGGGDGLNLFGLGTGSVLDGLAYTSTFIYDPETPGAVRESTPGFQDYVYGGDAYFVPSPMLSASITINGHTHYVMGHYVSQAHVEQDSVGYNGLVQHVASDYFTNSGGDYQNGIYSYQNIIYNSADDENSPGAIPDSLDVAFVLSLVGKLYGSFQFFNCDSLDTLGYCNLTSGGLIPASLVVTAVSGVSDVPLPAALPLLGLGLGALRFSSRQRERRNAA